jgi:hypothetical protein
MLNVKGLLALVFIASCTACNSTKNKPLVIDFSSDSTQIIIRDIDPVGMLKIRNGDLNDSLLQQAVTVMESPSEEDSTGMERVMPGKVIRGTDHLTFVPAEPFRKGKLYLVQTYINSAFSDLQTLIKGKTKLHMVPNQKTLGR